MTQGEQYFYLCGNTFGVGVFAGITLRCRVVYARVELSTTVI